MLRWTELRRGRWMRYLVGLVVFLTIQCGMADDTYVYAVQLTAAVQTSPPLITLSWRRDPYGATNYAVYRKAKEDTQWGAPLASLPGESSSFTDTDVTVENAYEYQVIKHAVLGYTGYGYIYSGINFPLTENRGTVLLLVATNSTVGLDFEIERLESDLVGDGWQVQRQDVSKSDTPQSVHAYILGAYWANPAHVNTVFLLGHVPVLQSGLLNYDGHGARAMPADAYYGDVYYDWSVDTASSPSYLPSDIPLMVGRVDLADMPGNGSAIPWPGEVELLRNYLNKDHNWRHKLVNVPRAALMGNRRGDEGGLAVAASGYRTFDPLIGAGNTTEANIMDTAPAPQRWSSMLAVGTYLWAYGCGAGQDTAIGALGTHGIYDEVWSTDIVGLDAKAVFVMMFGSHLGNWDHSDNIMRAVLATPDLGLACLMSGVPHWFFHHMGLGETIGYSTRLSMNNSTLYRSQKNPFTRAVYIALMGDPTLRMEAVAPPTQLDAVSSVDGVVLTWLPSVDAVSGYHVYRATSALGPFARITEEPVTAASFTDVTAAPGIYTYMVRAVALLTNPSGSYWNASQGAFTTVTVINSAGPVIVQAMAGPEILILTWNSQAGLTYRIQATDSLQPPNWTVISGTVAATGAQVSWNVPVPPNGGERFFRVATP